MSLNSFVSIKGIKYVIFEKKKEKSIVYLHCRHPTTKKPVLCFHLGMTDGFVMDYGTKQERECSIKENMEILHQIKVSLSIFTQGVNLQVLIWGLGLTGIKFSLSKCKSIFIESSWISWNNKCRAIFILCAYANTEWKYLEWLINRKIQFFYKIICFI